MLLDEAGLDNLLFIQSLAEKAEPFEQRIPRAAMGIGNLLSCLETKQVFQIKPREGWDATASRQKPLQEVGGIASRD